MVVKSYPNMNPKTTQQGDLFKKIEFGENDIIFGHAPDSVIEKFNLFCQNKSSLASAIVDLLGRAKDLKLKYKLKKRSKTYEMIAKINKK